MMTNLEYKQSVDIVIYLCSCAVNGTIPEISTSINLEHLYEAAQKHMLASMIGQVLKSIGISSPQFKDAIALAQRKAIILNNDLACVKNALEAAGIWYMPLKGAVLNSCHPHFAMREMCDQDILFDKTRADDVKVIMESPGFQVKRYGAYNDDDYFKHPVSRFEMHRSLFGKWHHEKFYKYYRDVKDRLVKDEDNSFGYHFTPEDFYIFMIAHEYKHFHMGGTGLRSLLDTYVLLHTKELNLTYVDGELEKLGIAKYEKQNKELADHLFGGEKMTMADSLMLDYILASGTYGTFENNVKNKIDTIGKQKYITKRIFGPMDNNDPSRKLFRKRYEVFFRHKLLLPFLPFYRLFCAFVRNPKRIKIEADAIRKAR